VTERFKMSAFTTFILKRDNGILLQRRCNTPFFAGYFAFPGGGFDGGETVLEATIREAREELCITVAPQHIQFAHVCHVLGPTGVELMSLTFQIESYEGEPTIGEPEKCDALEWFSLDALPENIVPLHKHILDEIAEGSAFSLFGWGQR